MAKPGTFFVGSIWQHANGIRCIVLFLANPMDTVDHPRTVVYQNIHTKTVWTHLYADWTRDFTWIGQDDVG